MKREEDEKQKHSCGRVCVRANAHTETNESNGSKYTQCVFCVFLYSSFPLLILVVVGVFFAFVSECLPMCDIMRKFDFFEFIRFLSTIDLFTFSILCEFADDDATGTPTHAKISRNFKHMIYLHGSVHICTERNQIFHHVEMATLACHK